MEAWEKESKETILAYVLCLEKNLWVELLAHEVDRKQIYLEISKFLRRLFCKRNHEPSLINFVTIQVIDFGLPNLPDYPSGKA